MKDFAELAEPLVALTWKGAPFAWMVRQQTAFDALKVCLIGAPILGFSMENGRFVLDTDARALRGPKSLARDRTAPQ